MNLISQRDYEDYLEHHGILGMKWGVLHGPPYPLKESQKSRAEIKLTSQGSRHRNGTRTENAISVREEKNVDKDAISKNVKSISSDTKELAKVISRIGKKQKITTNPLTDVSDVDLQKIITRLNLEKRYSELTKENTRSGYDKASDILSLVGSVVGIAGSTVAIYATLKK